jgi:hypothetical protein
VTTGSFEIPILQTKRWNITAAEYKIMKSDPNSHVKISICPSTLKVKCGEKQPSSFLARSYKVL